MSLPNLENLSPEEQVRALSEELEKANKNVSAQNSYITKLEQQNKAKPTAPPTQPATQPTQNNNTQVNQMMQEFIVQSKRDKLKAHLKSQTNPEIFTSLEADYDKFLDEQLAGHFERCTDKYLIDAFALVWGKANINPKHAIHQIGKDKQPAKATPTSPKPVTSTPVMTNKDNNYAPFQQPTATAQPAAKNHREAINIFKERLYGKS